MMIKCAGCFYFILCMAFSTLITAQSALAVEINSPMAPIAPPKAAPLPNSNYAEPRPNQNYQPVLPKPGTPTFKLNKGPDINHQQWCNSRYKSYRSSDDTYVDHGGVRQNCQSPYPR